MTHLDKIIDDLTRHARRKHLPVTVFYADQLNARLFIGPRGGTHLRTSIVTGEDGEVQYIGYRLHRPRPPRVGPYSEAEGIPHLKQLIDHMRTRA